MVNHHVLGPPEQDTPNYSSPMSIMDTAGFAQNQAPLLEE